MNKHHLSAPARAYVTLITIVGMLAIGDSVYDLYANPIGWNWFVLALLTLTSGAATIRLPSVPATISISETFVFTSVLLFGTPAGVITVALDALVISLGLAKRGHPAYRIAFNVGALPAALWASSHLFFAVSSLPPLATIAGPIPIAALLKPLTVFAVSYFLLNSSLIVCAISLEKGLSPFKVWKENFAWLSLNYFGGASVAALLVSYTRNIDFAYLAFVLPLLAVLYITYSVSLGRVEDTNKHLRQLNKLYMSTIETLAMAIDAKDQITHGHIRRVQHFATELAKIMGVKDPAQLSAIEAASLLHDMGKLAVPEYILNKPGPLTAAEFEKMKLHASVGADILSAIEFPYPVVPIVRHHHESWNGSGYPDGLKGSDIPIGARILSVVDCFDALTSDRPYRPRLSDAEALKILMDRRGSMYDPLVVDTFVNVYAEISPQNPTDVNEPTAKAGLLAIGRSVPSEDLSAGSGLDDIAASTEEMLVLYDLAKGLTGQLELGDAAEIIAKHIRRIVPTSTCVFYVFDDKSDDLFAAHASGENASLFTGLRIPRGQRLTGWVAANKQTILNSDPVLDLGEVARAMRPRLRSCLSTSLECKQELVGVLTVYSTTKDAFTDDHKRIIEVVAKQVAETVRHAVEGDSVKTTVFRDQLTGLPNRHHLSRFIASETSSGGSSAELSIVSVDVDSLKLINRRHGRAAGDRVLSEVAEAIKASLRGADVLFRYESDEFVVLLTQSGATAAARVADRIAERIADLQKRAKQSEDLAISVTLGVATYPVDGTSIEELVAVARAQDRAKQPSDSDSPSVH
jgi:diguanylate cyclase (GGDEF)-like protein/putative nucleotidyltransferase with HDIG domain